MSGPYLNTPPAYLMRPYLAAFTELHETSCAGYLEDSYLTAAYLTEIWCAALAMQGNAVANKQVGMQANAVAIFQVAMQAQVVQIDTFAFQANVALYNTDNLRFLCDFPSRGNPNAVGTNAWGNTAATGNNWKASSTKSSATNDFLAKNLNTDVVEQIWRSNTGVITGITLDCDTELTQGVFLDTFALLNHNFTTSATVTLYGSTVSNFSTIGVTIPLTVLPDDENIYYIAASIPNTAYRYWRISIDDSTNLNNFVSVGTIVFGAATILHGECFVDQIEFQLKDFTDTIRTEGFTNVANARAQKKVLRLALQSLDYNKGNFKKFRSVFKNDRTITKCLWIPTPDPVDSEYTARYAVFSKLVSVPNERHNSKGADLTYVSFGLELDESL
jgi:hypothetical protein